MVERNPHVWVPSTLGHGETMCSKCKMTNREAGALGELNRCAFVDASLDPMTEPQQTGLVELRECPLCGDPMEIVGYDLMRHVTAGTCLIGMQGWQYNERNVTAWNDRADPPELAAQRALVAELVGAVEKCASKLESERDDLLASVCLVRDGTPDRSTIDEQDAEFVAEFDNLIDDARATLARAQEQAK